MASINRSKTGKKKSKTYILMLVLVVPVVVIVSLYFSIRLNPVISQFRIKTDIVDIGTLETSTEVDGVVIRDESVYSLTDTAHINWNVSNGEKVARQQKLADILVSESDQSLMMEKEMINMRIEMLESDEDMSTFSEEAVAQLENRMDHIISDLAQNIQQNQYELVYKNRYIIDELAQQLITIEASKELPEMSLEELRNRQEQIESKMDSLSNKIRADVSGIFSAGTDGLENIIPLTEEELNESETKTLWEILNSSSQPEIKNHGFRIIHDHHWTYIAQIPADYIKYYEPNMRTWVRDIHQNRLVRGKVLNTQKMDNNAIVSLEFNVPLEGWHQKRLLSTELVPRQFEGLLVPVSSLAVRNGKTGVFRVDLNGYAVFMPVEELGRDDEIVVLKEGPIEIMSDAENDSDSQMVETIRRYDQIIINPENVQEGQRVR
ncbi:MAG: hypothetical protein D5S00_11690 [Tindallia sp. MSAO_Bac2]|nr:MAG: hypothetical protein D5S00_11690 [Tindallia sp. MSAO_Bac2]